MILALISIISKYVSKKSNNIPPIIINILIISLTICVMILNVTISKKNEYVNGLEILILQFCLIAVYISGMELLKRYTRIKNNSLIYRIILGVIFICYITIFVF